LFRRQRAAEIISLRFVALVRLQKRQLAAGFDTFGDHAQVQALRHAQDGLDDGGLGRRLGDLPDKGLVDLQRIDRKARQVAEARIAGAKIVDRQAHTLGTQGFQDSRGAAGTFH